MVHTATAQQISLEPQVSLEMIRLDQGREARLASIGLTTEVLARFAGALGDRAFIPAELRPGLRPTDAATQAALASDRFGVPVLVGHSDPKHVMLIDVGSRQNN